MVVVVLVLLVAVVAALLLVVSQRRAAPPIEVDDAVAELAKELREWSTGRNEEDEESLPARPTTPIGAEGPGEPAQTAPHPARQGPSLADLLEPVKFPEDLLPLTHGMSPVDLAFRLVLSTRQAPASVRAWLDQEMPAAGFAVTWHDDTRGVARAEAGAVLVELHPPVDPATVVPEEPESRRRRKRQPIPRRPDFPSAPFEATVVELTLTQ